MLWFGLSLIALLLIFWVGLRLYRRHSTEPVSLRPRKTLMDSLLRDFKLQLERAVGEDYEVFPHIRLADLLVTESDTARQADDLRLKIQTTTTDFVLTEKNTSKIACVLILIHHGTLGSRQQFIRQICQQSKLPFLILDVHNALSDKQLRQKIITQLEPTILLDEHAADDVRVYLDPGQRDEKRHQAGLDV